MANNNGNDKNMLGEFLSTVIEFALKMLQWGLWACFRATELISGAIASWIKNNLTQ
jgi:hypothetical protein